jgi:hypothetical protein
MPRRRVALAILLLLVPLAADAKPQVKNVRLGYLKAVEGLLAPDEAFKAGLVASFARPGGNLTGMAGLGPELGRKRVELLKDLVPSLSQAAVRSAAWTS